MDFKTEEVRFTDWMMDAYNKLPLDVFSPSAGLIVEDGKIVGLEMGVVE